MRPGEGEAVPTVYCQPVLPSAGLGNRLFPWARCRVFSRRHGVPMLAPRWAQVKLGPLLRGERDRRFYRNLFRTSGAEIHGVRRAWVRCVGRWVPEPDRWPMADAGSRLRPAVLLFGGERGWFGPLAGEAALVRAELRAITRPVWLRRVDALPATPIGIHVRRGDFRVARTPGEFLTGGSLRTPESWFVESLLAVRRVVGRAVPAFVVSDADDAELGELLGLDRVRRISTGSAIADLLALSRARFLIASGGSTFSAWAAFLGQSPAISHPGQSLRWFRLTHEAYVGECDPRAPLSPRLVAEIESTLGVSRDGVSVR